jgi:alkaline phosphatase
MFIGDGMGTAQIQSARFYQGTVTNNGAITEAELSFTQFPEVGSVTTYDSTSFCPDSASTATSIATGHKTESGVINTPAHSLHSAGFASRDKQCHHKPGI